MGFSSFGAKPNPKKKRKLEQTSTGSGSNSLPLGAGRRQESQLVNKIDIGSDKNLAREGNEIEEFGMHEAEKDENGDAEISGKDGVPTPHNLSNAHPPRAPNTDPSPERRNSHTAKFNDANTSPDLQLPSEMPPFHSPNSLPPRPPPSMSSVQHVQSPQQPQWPAPTQPSANAQLSSQAYETSALRKGIRDENGDMAYYDESFVEDPWRLLGM